MPKFNVSMSVVIYYTKDYEIEADDIEDAEEIAKEMYRKEDVESTWDSCAEIIDDIHTTLIKG